MTKRYFLFASEDSAEWFGVGNNVGMVDAPEEAVAIVQQGNYKDYQLFEVVDNKLQPASARCPVTNTAPNPQDPDNSKRRLLIEYLEMNDGTAYEVKRTPQVLREPSAISIIYNGSGNYPYAQWVYDAPIGVALSDSEILIAPHKPVNLWGSDRPDADGTITVNFGPKKD